MVLSSLRCQVREWTSDEGGSQGIVARFKDAARLTMSEAGVARLIEEIMVAKNNAVEEAEATSDADEATKKKEMIGDLVSVTIYVLISHL